MQVKSMAQGLCSVLITDRNISYRWLKLKDFHQEQDSRVPGRVQIGRQPGPGPDHGQTQNLTP